MADEPRDEASCGLARSDAGWCPLPAGHDCECEPEDLYVVPLPEAMPPVEARAVFRRWVSEYFEVPPATLDELPARVYDKMVVVVLEDMEARTDARRR